MNRPGIVHRDEVQPQRLDRPGFASARRQLGRPAGGRGLGCSHMEVPPGAAAWPYHWHAGNEEAIYVLQGRGTLRRGDGRFPIAAGDYVALPPGPEHAHQLINDGEESLVYLCLSTQREPDIGVYPDSGKVGLFVGSAPGGPKEERSLHCFLRADAEVDYWDGE